MKKIFLIVIVLVAFILRFWRLGDYPAFNADEAAIGYNAYCLIETGMDEHANPWPVHFQSFNDFKPGLYFYLVLPFVKYMGLNEWAVRIPGALMGVGTVVVLYFFVRKLFEDERIAFVSSFFLAISPWHIHFSRGAWEVNAAAFFILSGLYLFIKGVTENKGRYVFLSVFPLVASFYTYHAARIVLPVLGLGVKIAYRDKLKLNLKTILVTGAVGIVLLLPLANDFVRGGVFSRAAGVGLFADTGPVNRINEQRGQHGDLGGLLAVGMHNKVVNYSLAFWENYFDHFHGGFLFASGDGIQRNKVPEMGQMYLHDILFVLAGAGVLLLSKKWSQSTKFVVFWWLLAAPLAAALTFQSPHALRSQNMVIPLVILSSVGFVGIVDYLKGRLTSKIALRAVYFVLFTFIAWGFAHYQHQYWVHMAKEYPASSQYGVKELVEYVGEDLRDGEIVFVTDRYDQPYILFLFYLKYPPEKFQKDHVLTSRDSYGFSTVREFDRYVFGEVDIGRIKSENQGKNVIIAAAADEVGEKERAKGIYGTNGHLYFRVLEVGN